jgi:stearoyl-CoA desaturase (Delta-9 desaturase)
MTQRASSAPPSAPAAPSSPPAARALRDWTVPVGPASILYVAVHLGAVAAFLTGIDRTALVILAATYFARIFGLGAGYHRYFSHRAFKTSRPMQFFLALLGTTAMQRGALWWAETHRAHHRHTDTPKDLHSPHHQGFAYSHFAWFFAAEHRRTKLESIADFARYPELVWLNSTGACALVAAAYGAGLWWAFGLSGFLWGFCVSTVATWHTVHWIQSMSHWWGGYRRFETTDHSRNHWLLGLVSLGEFHNNHHYRASSARQGYVWWEIDIVWLVLRGLAAVGLVWDLRDTLHSTRPSE